MPPALEAADLSFAYHPGRWVFRRLSAAFEPGLVTAVLGPNGSGKSTLLRCLLGLLRPREGAVRLAGDDVHAMREPERAARIAYVPQRPSAALGFTVADVAALGCGVRTPGRTAHAAAAEALRLVDLADRAADPFAELSQGQQQRAVLARALAQLSVAGRASPRPLVLLADEPTSALDPRHAVAALDLLRARAREGHVVVVVLHDLSAALRAADRVLLLSERGEVAAAGPPSQALDPGTLARVFGIGFARLAGSDGRQALVPAPQPPNPPSPPAPTDR